MRPMSKKPVKKVKAKVKISAKARPKSKAKPAKISVDFEGLPVKQIAALISDHLAQAGYDPVLIGRGCAAAYIGAKLRADALDFVLTEHEVPELADAMKAIGFSRTGIYTFESKKCPVDVIFSPPPLAVGDDLVKEIATMKIKGCKVRLLNPTDCVRQRLAMYYRWGDKEAFEDAVEMAQSYEIDMELVKKWSDWEWCGDGYGEFVRELTARKKQ